ncbi:methyl-accepting chemotaxis protein [Salisediminibacterium selenitireducens]|uniref:Methyl-accepting chemotaxis sensory transducer with Cache sensor n=1 Tax=Bacillus selenitireducens (strain ATCC 700615 / DSM 15326 / MLS10) TaxID=439292 RepID=D6XXP2_BACIE|nr:methyl-accepting chemotaxis protein [Salisediminibacterium selenitireducens]ADI00085.1 methyl-accepting chemotaxis sensory transducer with Cache sensor [[Bacillus] selenitireducens MLS10]
MKKAGSIQTKIMIFVALVVVAIVTLSYFNYTFAKAELENQIEGKMGHLSNEIINEMDARLNSHQLLGESLGSVSANVGPVLDRGDMETLIEDMLRLNDETFGMGVWFEPFMYDGESEYVGPYGYKDGEEVFFTDEYEDPAYDFHSQEWYLAGLESGEVVWTEPYFDEGLDTTLITTSVPMTDASGQAMGVISSDIDIGQLQEMVRTIDTGYDGAGMLIGPDEEFLVHPHVANSLDLRLSEDEDFSGLSAVLSDSSSGVTRMTYEGDEVSVYYEHLPRMDWTLGLVIPDSEAYATLNGLLIQMAILSIVIISLFLVSATVFSKKLTTPVKLLSEQVGEVASGNLAVHIEPRTNDEIGQLTVNFNDMVTSLRDVVKSVRSSVHTVSEASEQLSAVSEETTATGEEISRSIDEMAKGTNEAAGHAEQTNAATLSLAEELTGLVDQTNQLSQYSETVQELNESGMQQMGQLKEKSARSAEMVQSVEEVIRNLAGQMEQIGSITGTISSISEQTNLLALNASIEAARAGEHGKGFAVVADEVRKLAEESSSSAQNISDSITKLQADTKEVENWIVTSRETSDEQLKVSEDTIQAFGSISSENERMAEAIRNMAKDIEGIDGYKSQVVEAVSHIAAILEESAAASEEVNASSEEQIRAIRTIAESAENLQLSGEELDKLVKQFSVE